mgnify:CR=1 FL=1|jgi:uncharacterized ubiquitin-like protein YukD
MKKLFIYLVFVTLFSLSSIYSEESILILPFDSKYAASEKGTDSVYSNFSDELSDNLKDKYKIISGDKVIRILKKLNLDGITEFENSEIDLIIKESNAKYVIFGVVERQSKKITKYLTIKCMKVENKSIVFEDDLKLKLTKDVTYRIVKKLIKVL